MGNTPELQKQADDLLALLLLRATDCSRDVFYRDINSVIKDLNDTLVSNKISFHKSSEVKISLDKIDNLLSTQFILSVGGLYSSIPIQCSKNNIYKYAESLDYEMIHTCFGSIKQYVCDLILGNIKNIESD